MPRPPARRGTRGTLRDGDRRGRGGRPPRRGGRLPSSLPILHGGGRERGGEGAHPPLPDRLANGLHEPEIVGEVVDRIEAAREDLPGEVQVAQVRARVAAAGLAAAALVEGAGIAPVLLSLDVDPPRRGEEGAVP